MENIIKIFELGIFIVLICVAIVILIYPIILNKQFKYQYGKNAISYKWLLIQMIGIFSITTYLDETSSNGFFEAVGFTIIIFILAVRSIYKRTKKMGVDNSICCAAATAQFIAPFGIILIILLVSSLFYKDKKNSNK